MMQHAPPPTPLEDIVRSLRYKPGWTFWLETSERGQGCAGLTLWIQIEGSDTHDLERIIRVNHLMIVPAAAYNFQSWMRWVFEQILLVERHEAMEFFRVAGTQPYAPNHGPGFDPYTVFELTTERDRKTRYTGEVVE